MRWPTKRFWYVIGIAAVAAALFTAGYIRRHYVLPILMYHSVCPGADPKNRLVVSPQTFERQMRFLKEGRYHVLGLEEAVRLIRDKKKLPARSVVITFDDGYGDNYTWAFPVLKKYGFPATIFIIAGEVGRPEGDRLSWERILEMQQSGLIAFGSHTLGATPLVDISSEQQLRRQIFDSKKILEERLGKETATFSYPGGAFTPHMRRLVIEAGYGAAVVTNPGKKYPDDDIFALKRLRISENAANLFVFWIESSGFYNCMRERRHK